MSSIIGTLLVVVGSKIAFGSFYAIPSYTLFLSGWFGGNLSAIYGVYLLSDTRYRILLFTYGFLVNAYALDFHKHLLMFNFQPSYKHLEFSFPEWTITEKNLDNKTTYFTLSKNY